MNLKDKTVLVTGGSKGIGRAIVVAMAAQGSNVIINYASDEKAAKETVDAAKKYGTKILAIKADISNQIEVEDMFSEIINTFPSIDVLVNNGNAFISQGDVDNIKAYEEIYNITFLGQVRVTSEACKIMKKGKIIFISSVHSKLGHGRPDVIAYSAMKAALDSYMKNLAKALAPDILVNSIAPGRTLTPQWGKMSEEYKSKQASGHLIKRWIEPGEIADGVVFLAKNDAVCGEVLVIDGGMSLKVLG